MFFLLVTLVCVSGLQASSSSQVKVNDVPTSKRPNSDPSEQLEKKMKTTAACFWWVGLPSQKVRGDEEAGLFLLSLRYPLLLSLTLHSH